MPTAEPLVEYLTTTRLGEKGQLTIPKEYRETLGLETGAPVAVLRVGDGLILMPEQRRFQSLCDRIAATLAGAGITEGDLQATLPDARRRVTARHYPKLMSGDDGRRVRSSRKKR